MNFIKYLSFAGILILFISTGCKKDKATAPATYPDGYTGRLQYQLEANYNFYEYTLMQSANAPWLKDTLRSNGPYTLLAVNSSQLYSYGNWGNSYNTDLLRGWIIPGSHSFKKMPVGKNQPLKTLSGAELYFSKYVKGSDTIMTINGSKIIAADNVATNGMLQVIETLFPPVVYPSLSKRISSDPDLSLFAAAIQRAGLTADIDQESYTVLAPLNTAFTHINTANLGLGISTMDSLLQADPALLKRFVQNHMIRGKIFNSDMQYDFFKNNDDTVRYATAGGQELRYYSLFNFYNYFYGPGNSSNAPVELSLTNAKYQPINNEAAGKSVLNRITQVLAP